VERRWVALACERVDLAYADLMDPLFGEEAFAGPEKSFPCVSDIARSSHPNESYGLANHAHRLTGTPGIVTAR
jgi:hypothetical protein